MIEMSLYDALLCRVQWAVTRYREMHPTWDDAAFEVEVVDRWTRWARPKYYFLAGCKIRLDFDLGIHRGPINTTDDLAKFRVFAGPPAGRTH